jgi:hypothetical protein
MNTPQRRSSIELLFHRAFFNWVRINQSRFSTPSFQVIRHGSRLLRFTIPELHPAIVFQLSNGVLSTNIYWEDKFWGCKAFQAIPVEVEGGYACKLCVDECPEIHPNREALWADRVFEPFLEWVNSYLKPARWLALYRFADRSTSAAFVEHPDAEAKIVLPVWLNQDDSQILAPKAATSDENHQ